MKYEWRKSEKELYLPKAKPTKVSVPAFKFISISGEGNPNSSEFSDCISVLYSLSHAKEAGLERLSKTHREIYLTDFRKVPVEKLKTVLRFKVKSDA